MSWKELVAAARAELTAVGVKGPWDDEPDAESSMHAGLHIFVCRTQMLALCGYAAVPPTHPSHGKHYDHPSLVDAINVHGGLTYADAIKEHVVAAWLAPDCQDYWLLGFDCAHAWDVMPKMEVYKATLPDWPRLPRESPWEETYRTFDWVRDETKRLAEQLAAMEVA